jgi:uncharacterized repeat protein (TIGR03806 family)
MIARSSPLLPGLFYLGLVLASCGCDGDGGGGGPPDGEEPFGLTERVVVEDLQFPIDLAVPVRLETKRRFPELVFEEPVFLAAPPDGSGRLVVVERAGRILIFPGDDTVEEARLYLDIRRRVSTAGEGGLLGVAFHPDYRDNHFLYAYYTPPNPFRSRVSRFRARADGTRADPGSERVLLQFPQPFTNHNGGMIAFGPDRMLYVGSGDGGSADDPQNNAQNPASLLGKILRITPEGAIPPGNPFAGVEGARAEIWALGLRNPWRFSFDRARGTLWAGDVGQGRVEEIDIIEKGGNYGWRVYEGNRSNINPDKVPAGEFEAPVFTYGHSIGSSITGGYVYRGRRLPSYRGAYFYADFSSGRVWALVHDGRRVVSNTEVARLPSPVSFGEDSSGEIFVVSFDGRVFDFEESGEPGPPPFPELLSQTGLFTDTPDLEPAPGLIEYDVNARAWSDGAETRRWLALPGKETIGFSAREAWHFPVGTVLVQHFEMDSGRAEAARRLETRVLVHGEEGWLASTYRWRESGSDAELLEDARTETITLAGDRRVKWYYPGPTDCLRCHTEAAGRVLGVRTGQLNRDFAYPGRDDNQLRSWNHIGLFGANIGDASRHVALPDPEDEEASLEARARAYLDANCSMCHRSGGPAPSGMDLRAGIDLDAMNAIDVRPSSGGLGLDDPRILKPGQPGESVLWERMRRAGSGRMPPLSSLAVDEAAVELIAAWIDDL